MNFKNQEVMEIDGWRVYDLPIECGEADYDEARVEIINQARNTPGLVALLEYGYIPYPGISDMDIWAVFCDDAEKMYLPLKPELSEKTKYLMSHHITLITEKHYRKMLYFDPWTMNVWPNGHRLLYKNSDIEKDVNFENIKFDKNEQDILSLTNAERFLALMISTLPFYINKELPVRHVLEELKTIIYITREINNITNRKISPAFSENIKDLMSNWFKIDREQAVRKLIKLFYEGLLMVFEIAFSLGDWARQYSQLERIEELGIRKTNFLNHSSLDKKAKNIYLNTFGDGQIFTDFVNTPLQALELSINSYQKFEIKLGQRSKTVDSFVFFMPYEAAAMFMGFVSVKGLLSDNLKKDTFSNLDEVPVFRPRVFQEKIKMINEITEIYNKKQVAGANGKGFLFGNNVFKYSFEHEKLTRKFLSFWLKRKFWRAIKIATKN